MQGSVTKVATEMKAKGKSVISEDLADEIHNKVISEECRSLLQFIVC